MTRQGFLILLSILALALSLTACESADSNPESEGVNTGSATSVPIAAPSGGAFAEGSQLQDDENGTNQDNGGAEGTGANGEELVDAQGARAVLVGELPRRRV